jgi:16S rRNA (cytosine967-C5)-methyltransferase
LDISDFRLKEVEKSRIEKSDTADFFDSSTFNSSTSSIAPARRAAYQILRQVVQGRVFAVELLQRPAVAALTEADRRLTTELVMGVLRWGGELDYRIEQLSSRPLRYFDPEVATILRLGIYQILFLGKIPKSAAVNECVELVKRARKRSAADLVNAVLRKCPVRLRPPGEAVSSDRGTLEAALRSLPQWLRERWVVNFGLEVAESLARVSVSAPRTTLRMTPPTQSREGLLNELSQEGIAALPARYAGGALVVQSGTVQASKAWREGRVVIQDEASQLVAELVAPQPGQRILDLCAAPGMKTAQLATALTSGTLVACDSSLRRLQTMTKLLPQQHLPNGVMVHAVCQDAAQSLALGMQFDRILLDAPCSGTGTLARNPEVKWRLKPSDVLRLAETQKKMMRNALRALAQGGRLVYATCSLEPEENELLVENTLGENPDFRLLTKAELAAEFPSLSALFDLRGCFRTRPDLHRMDGFFAAVLIRV